MSQLFTALAESAALRRLYGPVCKGCNHDHNISDKEIESRTNRNHDATTLLQCKYGTRPQWPFCDKHTNEMIKTRSWKKIKKINSQRR